MSTNSSSAEISRRKFLKASAGGAAGLAGFTLLSSNSSAAQLIARALSGGTALVQPFNAGWLFGEHYSTGSEQPSFDDSAFEAVNLPHAVVPLSWENWDAASWEQVWIYRRHFDLPREFQNLRTFVDFEGALVTATPTINGTTLAAHQGGYLPFSYELTDELQASGNVLAVELDSTWQQVPPDGTGSGASGVDFLEPAGIYRDVTLRAVPQIFITDVYAKPLNVLENAPQVEVGFTLDAAVVPTTPVRVESVLKDGNRVLGRSSGSAPITASGQVSGSVTIADFGKPRLWSPADPYLYEVVTTLYLGNEPVHDFTRRIGFRTAVWEVDGFYLNGDRLQIFGLDRHQVFPYVGMAMPDRVQRRDAEILKNELNCNMVRCSHYPQSPAFLDACDELGLMVWEETPGWQYIGDTGNATELSAYQALIVQNVNDMVIRDRNRPSIIIWGVQVNESARNPTLYTQTKNLANQLDGTRQTSGTNTSQSLTDWVQEVFAYDDYSTTASGDATLKPPVAGVPYLITEAIGALDGSPHYLRTDPQSTQSEQAWMHAQVHSIAGSSPNYSGLLAWCAIDYDSLNGNIVDNVKTPGVIDTFRIPKPGAAFYQAQIDPAIRPVIAPAFYWDFGTTSPVTTLGTQAYIWSNVETIEVFVNGTKHATLTPDTTNFPNLLGPPFYLDTTAIDSSTLPELRLDGYIGGRRVTSRSFSSDPSNDRLLVTIDDKQLTADGSDATRVAFQAVDRFGAPRPYVQGNVKIDIDGPASYVGEVFSLDVSATPNGMISLGQEVAVRATLTNGEFAFEAAGGAGAVWVRPTAGQAGHVSVRVIHPTLGSRSSPPPTPVSGGPAADPGQSATWSDAVLTLEAPSGWTVDSTSGTQFSTVTEADSVSATWNLTPPDAVGSSAWLPTEVVASVALDGTPLTAQTPVPVAVAVALESTFNNVGTSTDYSVSGTIASVEAANFDGSDNSFSRQALAAATTAPYVSVSQGQPFTFGGLDFTWPASDPGEPDNTIAIGQTVIVQGAGTTLGFVGAGSPQTTGTGTVFYTDGTTDPFTITLDNYFYQLNNDNNKTQNNNDNTVTANSVVNPTPYVNSYKSTYLSAHGVRKPGGGNNLAFYVFFTSVPIDATKTVEAVTLPAGGVLASGSSSTGMHIFAIAVGPPGS
jgi:beta-galactosidase